VDANPGALGGLNKEGAQRGAALAVVADRVGSHAMARNATSGATRIVGRVTAAPLIAHSLVTS
jgi:hypothetical protein